MKYFFIQLLFFLLIYGYSQAQEAIIINHTCTDLSRIPAAWIDSVQQRMKLHYGHTSHGSQLITGLGMIEQNNSDYSFIVGDNHLPSEEGAFCIFDGQEDVLAVPTIYYWATEEGMQMTSDVLTHNPVINVSMWSWCGEMSTNDSAEVQRYIDSIEVLEARFPQVQFVYMTGHTDGTGAASGDNLRASNNQLREYCIANGKVLYDFEDIESWDPDGNYYEDASDDCALCTDWCNSHPEECLPCSSCAHSHCYNCYQKGKALWWMMARLVGWDGESQSDYVEQYVTDLRIYPNPVNEIIEIDLDRNYERILLQIWDIAGRSILNKEYSKSQLIRINVSGLANGFYFIHLQTPDNESVLRVVKE